MSTSLAIATVTATLQGLISRAGITTTAQSPDKVVQGAQGGSRVNLFLFHAVPNPAWRNMDMPGRGKRGERGFPPLALDLHYVLTGYGTDGENGDLIAQRVLGQAMSVLHDRSELTADEIRNFATDPQSTSGLEDQVERVRITHDPLSHEDLFRMWATFNTPYRVSAVYQASVVLIDSQRPGKSPMPVLRRGQDNRGVRTRLDAEPVLSRIEYREKAELPEFSAAIVGDAVRLLGSDLPVTGLTFLVRDSRRRQIVEQPDGDVIATLPVERISRTEARAKLGVQNIDGTPIDWSSGVLTIELRYKDATDPGDATTNRDRSTNSVPLALAPRLRRHASDGKIVSLRSNTGGRTILSLTVEDRIDRSRKAVLILTETVPDATDATPQPEMPARPRSYQILQDSQSTEFSPQFDISSVAAGIYWLRLRVDGVDTRIMQLLPANPVEGKEAGFEFDTAFKVSL